MPLQNRVTPLGELVAVPERGLVYGNRGCLHDREGRIRRRYAVRRWIACRLEFNDRRRKALLQPGRYTELFFLDDATAFAAGHRPCAECRRADYDRFRELVGARNADAMDKQLHAERIDGPRFRAPLDELPDGTFVLADGEPWLVLGSELLRWTPGGYTLRRRTPSGEALLITPPTTLEVLRAGWEPVVPFLHPSAVAPQSGGSSAGCSAPSRAETRGSTASATSGYEPRRPLP
jgi:hypothetical protein